MEAEQQYTFFLLSCSVWGGLEILSFVYTQQQFKDAFGPSGRLCVLVSPTWWFSSVTSKTRRLWRRKAVIQLTKDTTLLLVQQVAIYHRQNREKITPKRCYRFSTWILNLTEVGYGKGVSENA